ncbi:MAG TPA: Ku protein [Terriglobales bacterium]|jgi:DNA end-binding protein Ku|nr:Ku protein [Terriglobales bacterium]
MASTVWKGHLTFGLVSLPVRLYSAARAETVSFNQLHKTDNSRIKMVMYCQLEDKPITRADIVKGYEYEKDKYVVVEEEEIKKVAPTTAKTMEILEFVKADEVDPIFFESSYYLAPEEAGEKPYALLYEALRRSGHVGVAKIAMHNREHIVILRPGEKGILLHTMFYRDEIRQVDEFRTNTSLVKDKELELATTLVNSLAAPFEPEKYRDEYRANLQSLIEAKKQGKATVEAPAPVHMAPVVDILEALKMSLAEARKPPVRAVSAASGQASEAQHAPRKRARKTSTG